VALAGNLQITAGASFFVTCMCGWWIFAAIMLASLDFPVQLPGESLPSFLVMKTNTNGKQSAICPGISRAPATRRRTRTMRREPGLIRMCKRAWRPTCFTHPSWYEDGDVVI
jgi:hypothetical protein